MPQYKAILFDLWDTLAQISNLDNLSGETKNALGDDRYSIMMVGDSLEKDVEGAITKTTS
ncbi:MAG: hypothetical protein ABIC82_00715 [bacterium]